MIFDKFLLAHCVHKYKPGKPNISDIVSVTDSNSVSFAIPVSKRSILREMDTNMHVSKTMKCNMEKVIILLVIIFINTHNARVSRRGDVWRVRVERFVSRFLLQNISG